MSVTNLVKHAKACHGYTLQKCADYFGVTNPKIDWCGWFARMCGSRTDVNMDFGSSNVAADLKGIKGNFAFKSGAQGTTANKPKVGDLLFIQPKGQTQIKHVGICSSVDPNGKIKSYEGNMSGVSDNWINTSTVKEASYDYNTGDGGDWGKIINYGMNS